jgi:hypothetical protein
MFFSVTNKINTNYSKNYQLGSFVVNTDSGWKTYDSSRWHAIYKGYADDAELNSFVPQLLDNPCGSQFLGNFCVVAFDKNSNTIKIITDRYRSFPIYVDQKEVTNLTKYPEISWADTQIEIMPDLSVKETRFDVIGELDDSELDFYQVADKIQHILDTKTKNFVKHNRLPIKVYLSGGVDSLLVYSFLQKYTTNFEFITCEHFDFDYFWVHNKSTVAQNWAYKQIHHWIDPCVLTSGAPGDEFFLRSPYTSHVYLDFHNHNTLDLLKNKVNCLHYNYFNRPEHLDYFNKPVNDKFSNKQQLMYYLCNNVVNDWQHWHIGNTLTWTPLRDLEIYKLILRLPLDQAVDQIFDSKLSKYLIENNKPGASTYISNQKNDTTPLINLVDFLKLPR